MDGGNHPVPIGVNPVTPTLTQDQMIELEKQRDQHQYDIAVKNLEALSQNNIDMREKFYKGQRNAQIILGITVGLIFAFFMTALWLDKDAFITDLIKIISGGIGGGGLGYMAGFKRGRIEPYNQSPPQA